MKNRSKIIFKDNIMKKWETKLIIELLKNYNAKS